MCWCVELTTSSEKLYEDKTFSERKLAALVASKVYFHLDELQRATEFALGAEELFDLTQDSEFVNTMISTGRGGGA